MQAAYFNYGSDQLSVGQPLNAARSFQQAIHAGHGEAHAALAFMHYGTYVGIPFDPNAIFKLASAGAAIGCVHSKGALADCYMNAVGAARDERRGVQLAKESAAAGSMYGQSELAIAHFEGFDGAPKDHVTAASLFTLAANQGEAHSLGWLARMHAKGLGVRQSKDEADRALTRLEAMGYAHASLSRRRLGLD